MLSGAPRTVVIAGAVILAAGIAGMALSPALGSTISDALWLMEPMAIVGIGLIVTGLVVIAAGLSMGLRGEAGEAGGQDTRRLWSQLTQHYFDVFGHDMGRPIRRILGKEREVRTRLSETGRQVDGPVMELLDEIEQQAPSFRLMVSNIQVLVQLEDEGASAQTDPVAPAQVVRNVVDRYTGIGRDHGVTVSWWSEPDEFGLEYCDAAAVDHIVTNLVDNAVRYAQTQVEVRLTRNPTHFFIRIWDDGPGIPDHFVRHVFDRGWTPEVASRQERTTSGLGLYIARTLARRSGGELTVDTDASASNEHHTAFTLALPRVNPDGAAGNR